jgi:hypothetical protein
MMAIKLTRIVCKGRYRSPDGRVLMVFKGRRVGRSVDMLFWKHRGSRNWISDLEFSNSWELVESFSRGGTSQPELVYGPIPEPESDGE